MIRLFQLERQIELSHSELSNKIVAREAVEKKVVMMRPDSISRDLLEERIQKVLGYAASNDYIVNIQ